MTVEDLYLGKKKLEDLTVVQNQIKQIKNKKNIKEIDFIETVAPFKTIGYTVVIDKYEQLQEKIRLLVLEELQQEEKLLIKYIEDI